MRDDRITHKCGHTSKGSVNGLPIHPVRRAKLESINCVDCIHAEARKAEQEGPRGYRKADPVH